MKLPHVIAVAVLFTIGCTVAAWRTEWFQQRVFPETHWHQKVAELKQKISASEFSLGDIAIQLEKKRRTADLEIMQTTNRSKLVGMDSERASKEAAEQITKEITVLTDFIRMMQEGLERDREQLAVADEQLARYTK